MDITGSTLIVSSPAICPLGMRMIKPAQICQIMPQIMNSRAENFEISPRLMTLVNAAQ